MTWDQGLEPDDPLLLIRFAPGDMATELVALRAYDSDRVTSGERFWTPHTAFADPTVFPSAPARVSVQMRAICQFLR